MSRRHAPEEYLEDLPLFPKEDRARARNTDPGTSHAAAASIASEKIRQSQQRVRELLALVGPKRDDELFLLFIAKHGHASISPSGLRTRRAELVEKGLVHDTGRRERMRSGRLGVVWEAS